MVDSLFAELDAANRENAELRARCERLEAQAQRRQPSPLPLPELEPLEMPTFDSEQGS